MLKEQEAGLPTSELCRKHGLSLATFYKLKAKYGRMDLSLWRYDYNNVRPHSALGNKTPAEARPALEQSEGFAPGMLAQPETDHYQPQGLS